MKTIDRFILKSYLGPMILTFFIVMFVLMMNFMWRYIDELVGKGLEPGVIAELMMYAATTLIPMGLPLATLLAAIMTMGNLGENYELLALKSSGMSLPRIMRPLIIVVFFISVGSFFVANNLVPFSMRKMNALIFDIRQQKQAMEFSDGLFFNGIENMSIRVGHQDPETKLLTEVLIYDNRDPRGNMSTTVAQSGYINLTDDKKFLSVQLHFGESFDETRNHEWYTNSKLERNFFDEQNALIGLEGYDFERSDASMFQNSQTKKISELQKDIDSLKIEADRSSNQSYDPILRNYIFANDKKILEDSVIHEVKGREPLLLLDSLYQMDVRSKSRIWTSAVNTARSSRNLFSFDEQMSKEVLNQLYRNQIEYNKKLALPVSIMIFFLIGAPLGAIIRKGGLGMPIVVSVLFFVVYYIISITGEKLAKEGSWDAIPGTWISTFILFPVAVFLVYKATNDSNLFNFDWYYFKYRKFKNYLTTKLKKDKNVTKTT